MSRVASQLRSSCVCAAILAGLACSPAGDAQPPRKDIVGSEKKLQSQFDEELVIRDFFQDRKGGFLLDVGSAHPSEMSTTYYLEEHLAREGIAIDAQAHYAPAYAKLRPRTRFFSYIVTDHAGSLDKFYLVRGAEGLSSTEKGRSFMGKKLAQKEIRVPTITPNLLLEQNGILKIDFLSMDIERGAPKALAGFDIEKHRPEFVQIEHSWDHDVAYNEALIRWFREHGYERLDAYDATDRINWHFTPGS